MDTGKQNSFDILELITKSGAIQGQGTPVSLLDLVVALVVASLVGLFSAWIYQRTHRGMTYERTFLISVIMIGPIISWIIMLIGSNLALSLGMVGALSIIRFRNVIKDSRDMIYLFWGIAIGLGSGTYNWAIVITASICIGCVMVLLDYLKYGRAQSQDCIFVLRGEGNAPESLLFETISGHTDHCAMRSMEANDAGWELVFEVQFPTTDANDLSKLLTQVRGINGVKNASLLAPHLSLPV